MEEENLMKMHILYELKTIGSSSCVSYSFDMPSYTKYDLPSQLQMVREFVHFESVEWFRLI